MSDLAVAASPRELIPGDPDGVEAVARRFDTYADGATEAAARLRDIDAGAWVGEAANAFRGAIGDIPEKLERGSRAFSEAGSALFDYARALRDAQAKAVQALEGFREAETATSAWSSQVDRYESDLKSTEAAGTPPPFGPPPPSVDPGAAGRSQATSLLEEARADVEEAAERAAARLEEAGDQAPDEPGLLSKAWDQISEFGKGVGEATYGLLEFGFKLSPTYALINPEGYVENLEALGKGLAYGVTHPVEFGKAVLDWETWKESSKGSLGHLVSGLALAAATAASASPASSGAATPGQPGGRPFVIGPPTRPNFDFDSDYPGKPDDSPSLGDRLSWAKWEGMLRAGELVRSDLDDATTLYRHYMDGSGDPLEIDYEEAYREDENIRRAVDSQLVTARKWADRIAQESGRKSFSMSGDAVPAEQLTGGYPAATENWQKSLGGHQLWSSAQVEVHGDQVTMTATVNAEDRYNFNAGQSDIATGAPDDENVRFAQLGWAKGFNVHGEVTRTVTWRLGDPDAEPVVAESGEPDRNPGREDREDERDSGGPDRKSRPGSDRNTGRRGG